MKTGFIRDVLWRKFGLDRGFFSFEEFGEYPFGRKIDFITVGFRYSETKSYQNFSNVTAFEIKVSSNDFCREIANPTKREPFVKHSNRFYFVCPKDLIDVRRIPDDCGLIYIYESGRTKVIKEAPKTEIENPCIIFGRMLWHLGNKYGYNGKKDSVEVSK